MPSEPWSDAENDLIVAEYFAMLIHDVAGSPYNKSERRRALVPLLRGRTEASVEFKHQNISAVLKGLGETWIEGYKPAFNYQASLEEAVARWFVVHAEKLFQPNSRERHSGFNEAAPLWIGPAPTMSNQPVPLELEQTLRVAIKFDVAGRDERNKELGRAGEKRVLEHEHATLKAAGRSDLARAIKWVSEEEGDGAGYDIASYEPDGRPRLIEVKTTNGWERTPFMISRNECEVAETQRSEWVLFRLWNFARRPQAFELRPLLEKHVSLSPTMFQASFL